MIDILELKSRVDLLKDDLLAFDNLDMDKHTEKDLLDLKKSIFSLLLNDNPVKRCRIKIDSHIKRGKTQKKRKERKELSSRVSKMLSAEDVLNGNITGDYKMIFKGAEVKLERGLFVDSDGSNLAEIEAGIKRMSTLNNGMSLHWFAENHKQRSICDSRFFDASTVSPLDSVLRFSNRVFIPESIAGVMQMPQDLCYDVFKIEYASSIRYVRISEIKDKIRVVI